MSAPIDPTVMLLRSFCLATMAGQYEEVMRRAEQEGWSHRQVLRHLCEGEAVERAQKRTARLLAEVKAQAILIEKLVPLHRDQPVFRPGWQTDFTHFIVR